jgi:hypothetical protein
MMKYGPGTTLPIVNVNGFRTPLEVNTHVAAPVTRPGVEPEIGPQGAMKVPTSVRAKLLPVTVTTVPTGPDDGVSVIAGPVTVKIA